MINEKQYYKEKRRTGISYKKQKERKLHVVGSVLLRNFLLKQVIEGKAEEKVEVTADEKEDVSSYEMTIRKRDITGNRKKKKKY